MSRQRRPMTKRQNLAFGFFFGAIWATAVTMGQGWGAGLAGFLVIFGWSVFTSVVRGERFELVSADGPVDERQARLRSEAAELSGYVILTFALCGAVWDEAHGRFGEFGWVCAVGGFTYLAAQLILPRVR